MTDYQGFLTEFTPRLIVCINDPAAKIPPPKCMHDGSVFLASAIPTALAIGITEKKNDLQTISFMFVGGDYTFSSEDDPKMGCIIALLLSVIKTRAPFLEPPAGGRPPNKPTPQQECSD